MKVPLFEFSIRSVSHPEHDWKTEVNVLYFGMLEKKAWSTSNARLVMEMLKFELTKLHKKRKDGLVIYTNKVR